MNPGSNTRGRLGVARLLGVLVLVCPVPSCARAQGTIPTGFTDELIADSLSQPVGIALLPDGRVLVIEQRSARIKLIRIGPPVTVDSVGTVPGVNSVANERGLLGIAVDPGWPARPYLYTHSTHTGNHIRISRFAASGALSDPTGLIVMDAASRYDVLNDIPDNAINHNGGTVRFGPDGMLYVSLGEDASMLAAQDTTSLRGVILRVDVSQLPSGPGAASRAQVAAPGNPFAAVGSPNAKLIWAWGLRNPFRFQIDQPTGHLLISDVGDVRWEELDEGVSGGHNFGWPHFEGDEVHTPDAPLLGPVTAPIHVMGRAETGAASVVTAGMYRRPLGAQHAFPVAYDGDVFVSDYYAGFLRRLKRNGSTWSLAAPVAGQPSAEHWGQGFQTVSDYALGKDGALWYCRQFRVPFAGLGEVRRIVSAESLSVETPPATVSFAKPYPLPSTGRVEFSWSLVETSSVSLTIHDVRGRLVRTLVAPRHDASGTFHASWDGLEQSGRSARPGVYFARLAVNGRVFERRVQLVK